MGFNRLNSVEHYIIHQLSGANLNNGFVEEPKSSYGSQWVYKSPTELNRSVNEVLIESDLKAALMLKPGNCHA
jgi:type I restriction enzyme R subunit